MGYNTYFSGVLEFNEEVSVGVFKLIKKILSSHEANYNGKRIFLQFEMTEDFSGIQWDGSEKFYDAVDAVNYIIEKVKAVYPKFALKGELIAQGEDTFDRWKLCINDKGRAYKKEIVNEEGEVTCPHCGKDFKLE